MLDFFEGEALLCREERGWLELFGTCGGCLEEVREERKGRERGKESGLDGMVGDGERRHTTSFSMILALPWSEVCSNVSIE